jgi:hypothetical protein
LPHGLGFPLGLQIEVSIIVYMTSSSPGFAWRNKPVYEPSRARGAWPAAVSGSLPNRTPSEHRSVRDLRPEEDGS